MKFTTFIRAYKIILSDISKKVKDWDRVFITQAQFDDSKLQLVFSNSKDMSPGAIALRTTFNYSVVSKNLKWAAFSIDELASGIEKLSIADTYANLISEVNDAGKFISILDFVLSQLKDIVGDVENDVQMLDVYFDTVNNLVVFGLSLTDEFETFMVTLRTDGHVTMFSDYSEDNHSCQDI